jgi:hypothetical protein
MEKRLYKSLQDIALVLYGMFLGGLIGLLMMIR